jgi:hypothetical protein
MIRRLFLLVLFVVGFAAAYVLRPEVRDVVASARERWAVLRKAPADSTGEDRAAASAEIAARAKSRLESLGKGTVRVVSFTDAELQSLLEFEYRQLLPAFVDSPRISLDGDHLRLRVRMPVERLPGVAELGEIAALLPDTTNLDVRGTILPGGEGHVAFAVDGVSAQRIPLPKRIVPSLLTALGREDKPGLPADAIDVPLPKGVRAAYVRGDSLVLLAREPARKGN